MPTMTLKTHANTNLKSPFLAIAGDTGIYLFPDVLAFNAVPFLHGPLRTDMNAGNLGEYVKHLHLLY